MITLLILLAGLQVHEWGIITQDPMVFTGNVPVFEPWQDELEDKAPVLYFHGDPCTVTLRVSFPSMGFATTLLPEADQGGTNSTYILWEDLILTESAPSDLVEGWNHCDELGYPVSLWRDVDALYVEADEEFDRFVYYGCVPGSPGDLPFISESGNHSMRMPYGETPCVVLKSVAGIPMFGVFTLADIVTDIPKGLQFLEDTRRLKSVISGWAEGVLFEDEFEAFWNTWESRFLTDSEDKIMILYPVPGEIVENISTLEVIPDRDIEIEISRFIIAELPYITE